MGEKKCADFFQLFFPSFVLLFFPKHAAEFLSFMSLKITGITHMRENEDFDLRIKKLMRHMKVVSGQKKGIARPEQQSYKL